MVSWIQSKENRGRVFWAHNGGRFDYISLFGNYVSRHSRDLTRVNGRLIELRLRSGRNVTRLRDSYNLFPRPLASLGVALGYPKGETPQKFIDADRSQGITEKDYEYCVKDCRILYESIMALQSEFGEVRATLPSMALSVFKRRYISRNYFIPTNLQALDLEFRKAYYGGRVEAYFVGPLNFIPHYYDINSLYPMAMIEARFPNPMDFHSFDCSQSSVAHGDNGLWHMQHHEGYAECGVEIPANLDPPPLPYRRLEDRKLLFPTGNIYGCWTFNELRMAVTAGCHIFPKRLVCARPLPESPFLSYVNDIYAKKQTTEGVMREVYKLLLNGLYGKFGEFHRSQNEYAERFNAEYLATLRAKHPDAEWKPINRYREDGYYEWASKDGGEASHAIYSWASIITAQARIINWRIQRKLLEAGIHTLYTDTDSFLTDASIITDAPALADMIGPALGQLKEEPKIVTEIWGAKAYLTTEDRVLKGVGKRAQPIAYWLDSKKPSLFGNWGITTASSAIRYGTKAGSPKYMVKTGVINYDKRRILSDGRTEPHKL